MGSNTLLQMRHEKIARITEQTGATDTETLHVLRAMSMRSIITTSYLVRLAYSKGADKQFQKLFPPTQT